MFMKILTQIQNKFTCLWIRWPNEIALYDLYNIHIYISQYMRIVTAPNDTYSHTQKNMSQLVEVV